MQKLFIIEKRETVTLKDGLYLRNLYQPLIGNQATMLYELFLDYYYLNKAYKSYFNLYDLALVLGVSQQEIINDQHKLEAVGLIRTFVKNDSKHFIINLNRPLNIDKFTKNPLLYKALISKIGDEMFERVAFAFKKPRYDKSDFNEITTKFQDVFSVNDINNSTNNTVAISLPTNISKDDAIKSLTPTQFINYLTKSVPSPSLLRNIHEIQQMGFASYSINLIIDYSFTVNDKIINNHIKKIAKNLYDKDLIGFEIIKRDLESAKKYKMGYKDVIFDKIKNNFFPKEKAESWDFFINHLGEF